MSTHATTMTATRLLLPLLALGSLASARPAAREVDVTSAGAVGDGATLNTAALQKAIDDCGAAGGGVVRFPSGRFLTGTLRVRSGVTLRLDEGAVILGSADVADYQNVDPFSDGNGHPLGHALIVGIDAEHVGIEGKGTIDGQGAKVAARQKPFSVRPFLVRWVRCKDVGVRGVTLANPGAWTLNLAQCSDAVVEDVTIRSRDQKLRNNDGVNVDSSEHVRVRRCDVVSGDDALVIKATSASRPCRDIEASNCRLSTRTNAIKLGTESIGGFEEIRISGCQITDTKMSGIALYTVDGGDLKDVRISDVTMDGVTLPISVRLGARLKAFREGEAARTSPGVLKDVLIENVTAKNVGLIGMLINGVPGHPVEALTLKNVTLEAPGGGTREAAGRELPEKETAYPEYNMFGTTLPASGAYLRHVRGMKAENLKVTVAKDDARPKVVMVDVEGVEPKTLGDEK